MRTKLRWLAIPLVIAGAALVLFVIGRGPAAFEASREGAPVCGQERLDSNFVSQGMDPAARRCFYRASLAGTRVVFESRRADVATYWIVTPEGNVDVWTHNSYAPWVHLEDCRLESDPNWVFAFRGAGTYFFGGGEAGNDACLREWAYEGSGPPTEVTWQPCRAGILPTTCPVRVKSD